MKGSPTLEQTEKRMTNQLEVSAACGENLNFVLAGICMDVISNKSYYENMQCSHYQDYRHIQ